MEPTTQCYKCTTAMCEDCKSRLKGYIRNHMLTAEGEEWMYEIDLIPKQNVSK